MKYEATPKKKVGSDRPADYEIRVIGAGKGAGKVCTVHGYYGVNAEARAMIIVEALNQSES